jgi:hypothetical protein
LLHGPSVLDIAPTILTLYGLPVGEDMDGKVLTQAFVNPPEIASIPSWEDVPGTDGRHPPHTRLDPVAAHEAMEQMIALGYIERPDENRELAVGRPSANFAITWARPFRTTTGIWKRTKFSPSSTRRTRMSSALQSGSSSPARRWA